MKAYLVTYNTDGDIIGKPDKIDVNVGMLDDDYGEIVEIPMSGVVIDQDNSTAIFIPMKKLIAEVERFKTEKEKI